MKGIFVKVSDRRTFLMVSWVFVSVTDLKKVENADKKVADSHETIENGRRTFTNVDGTANGCNTECLGTPRNV